MFTSWEDYPTYCLETLRLAKAESLDSIIAYGQGWKGRYFTMQQRNYSGVTPGKDTRMSTRPDREALGGGGGRPIYERPFTSNDVTGQRFGNLTAQHRERRNGVIGWICQCDCGEYIRVTPHRLLRGITTSCPTCLRRKNPRVADDTTLQQHSHLMW